MCSLWSETANSVLVMRSKDALDRRSEGRWSNVALTSATPGGVFSIFGKVELYRPYFYQKELGGQILLDAELSLERTATPIDAEITEYLGLRACITNQAILERLLGLPISTGWWRLTCCGCHGCGRLLCPEARSSAR